MPSTRSSLALGTGLALAVALAGSAGASPTVHRTAAGRALARAALLKRSDLGPGWSAGPVPGSVPALTCPGFSPALRGAVENATAVSAPFQDSVTGDVVTQSAFVFAAPAQATSVAKAVMRRKLLSCVAQSLVAGSSHGVHFTVAARHLFSLPRTGAKTAGYRVSGTASMTDQTLNAYLDEVVLARGRTVTAVSYASLEQPFDAQVELRLARIVAGRIKGQPPA